MTFPPNLLLGRWPNATAAAAAAHSARIVCFRLSPPGNGAASLRCLGDQPVWNQTMHTIVVTKPTRARITALGRGQCNSGQPVQLLTPRPPRLTSSLKASF
ncbi:hypothetical protein AAFF_G00425250 [Aldrovandia affinis]|uniref:Uncharacterized protein n=1 Tax=Aldrovandia affinis TaxID=143900 RepID=A0AAD7X090_9TELE|nr:hypothetical protein AAFF_G00425250 [Aldrovandia affinis]